MKTRLLLSAAQTSALLIAILIFAGCAGPAPTAVNSGTADAVTSILGQINTKLDSQDQALKNLHDAQDQKDSAQAKTTQFITDRMDESRYANANNPQQNGATTLVETNLGAAATAIGVQPSPEAKAQEVLDLRDALSQVAADKQALAARNVDLQSQAQALKGQVDLMTLQVKDKEVALAQATVATHDSVKDLADEKARVVIDAKETSDANAAAAKSAAQKSRLEVARWFMLAGGAIVALGIVLLLFHVPDAWIGPAAGAGLLGIGWAVSYVEDMLQQEWFRITLDAVVVGSLLAAIWLVFRAVQHHLSTTAQTTGFSNLVGAIQELSSKDPTAATALQPILQEWHVTGTGATDTAVVSAINQAAVKLNVINPNQVAAAAGTGGTLATSTAAAPKAS